MDGPAAATGETDAQPASHVRFDLVAGDVDQRINALLARMTLAEKIGQLVQVYPEGEKLSDELRAQIRRGEIGSIFYTGDAKLVDEAQKIAGESRLGIPLVVARDVVHGFRTIFPIPLGQAATWNPELVEQAATVAANEAKSEGIDWTFAPMVDITRDPRWGRVAETMGEDPVLCGDLAAAMVRGFQQRRENKTFGVAACAKHFVAYGLSEGGRDYNRVSVAPVDLHNIYLPPFQSCIDAGCSTLMTTFSEVNGVPGTAHRELIDGLLKQQWGFEGVVVSDWGSVTEMIAHGYSANESDAAAAALMAGVDVEMCSPTYAKHLEQLVQSGAIPQSRLDDAVRRTLRMKVDLYVDRKVGSSAELASPESLSVAREMVRQSLVLLKNDGVLPLVDSELKSVAVIGPLADRPLQQLGCWSLDGKAEDSITPLKAIQERLAGRAKVLYSEGARSSFTDEASMLDAAVNMASRSDVVLLFVGEDATLSGEARSRADLNLPGVQQELLSRVAETKTPTVIVVLAGRPLTIDQEVQASNALIYAWHPGTMAGPAIADVLFGDVAPSGKLPITFPRTVGQIPLYYSHHNTGRPAPADYQPLMGSGDDDLPQEFQYRSHYLDVPPVPLFPFGFGLSYAKFQHSNLELSAPTIKPGGVLGLRVQLENAGSVVGTEVTQVYIRDRFSSVVRPVRELRAYRRTELQPKESTVLEFALPSAAFTYRNSQGELVHEPGVFDIWVGSDSTATLAAEVELLAGPHTGESRQIAAPTVDSSEATRTR
ncbi:glycoside hydrolase family 3 N-terminal domain-containing protein [Aeoliella sp.]|uniref:glycoside hydrolase family 3 N-terminal domain-containing protein n=1 Tax=Aeoliella sp. TaxID=2795800 RepID=UPI003CCBB06E